MKVGAFSVNEDTAANHFTGTPTHEIIPSLPPYHFGCRTRIVPYTHGDAYEAFDTMKPTDKLYPTILKDKLANYSITPQNLDTVRSFAHQCQWFKKGDRDSLQEHYDKHAKHFSGGERFNDKDHYDSELRNLIKNPNSSITLRIEKNSLIMYVYKRSPDSDKVVYEVVVNMDKLNVLTYSKRSEKQMKDKTDSKYKEKNMSWNFTEKKEAQDRENTIKDILEEFEQFDVINSYNEVIRVIKENDEDEMTVWGDEVSNYRMDEMQLLADAGLLSEEDIKIIKKVDDFIRKTASPISITTSKTGSKQTTFNPTQPHKQPRGGAAQDLRCLVHGVWGGNILRRAA